MRGWLLQPTVSKRFTILWCAGLLLNLSAWAIGYFFLPQGILRGALPAGNLPIGNGDHLWSVFLPIFLFNLLVAGGIVVTANLFRVGDFPLGYFVVCFHWTLYGLLLGTDSFGIPIGRKLPPSPGTLVHRSGLYEISAYTLIAAATTGLFLYRQRSWLNWTTKKVRRRKDLHLSQTEILVLGLAILLLATANLREALSIISGS